MYFRLTEFSTLQTYTFLFSWLYVFQTDIFKSLCKVNIIRTSIKFVHRLSDIEGSKHANNGSKKQQDSGARRHGTGGTKKLF